MTRAAVVESAFSRERANVAQAEPAFAAAPGAAMGAPRLRDQQAWFAAAVMTSDARVSAAEAARFLTAGPRLDALERLAVYRDAYQARLAECLADDYPALRAAVGEDAFDRVARAYVERHPSTSPNLNPFGRHMADFCRAESSFPLDSAPAPAIARPFLADLARLEWALVEVIHAPSAEPLTLVGLADVPIERWTDARLVATPALRLLRFDYPVNAFYQAFRRGESPAIPGSEATAAAVYRSGPTLWRMDLTAPMHGLLQALVAGETLGDALAHAVEGEAQPRTAGLSRGDLDGGDPDGGDPDRDGGPERDEAAAAGRVMGWFREWVSSGLFARVLFSG